MLEGPDDSGTRRPSNDNLLSIAGAGPNQIESLNDFLQFVFRSGLQENVRLKRVPKENL